MKNSKVKGCGLYLLALIFLVNPSVNIIDILPDFVAYLILSRAFSYAADRAPYFEETRKSFHTLALISFLKIPSYLIMNYAQSSNVSDHDISALFALVFAVTETVFIISAINNLFSALFYLGERSNAQALIDPFPINKKGTRIMSTDTLRKYTYIVLIYRNVTYFVPEILLLTRGVDGSSYNSTFNFAILYPYSVVILFTSTAILGIILAKRFYCYIKAIKREGKFREAIDSLLDEEAKKRVAKNERTRRMLTTLTLLAASSILTLEVRFDNFGSVNLLPHFLYGIIITIAIYKLTHFTKKCIPALVLGILYSSVAFAGFVMEIIFLDTYGYSSLVSSGAAKDAYIPLIISAAVEFVFLVAVIIFSSRVLSKYVKIHTGLDESNGRYMRSDAVYHKKMKTKIYIWSGFSIFVGLAQFIDVILKFFSKKTPIASDPIFGTITSGLIPWYGTLLLVISIAYIIYSFYLFGTVKEDTELKYSELSVNTH